MKDGLYLAHENCPDTFTLFNYDHPSMVGALGILPGTKVDPEIMLKTLQTILDSWQMDRVWGLGFPNDGNDCSRLGRPDLALDSLLFDSPKMSILQTVTTSSMTGEIFQYTCQETVVY